MGVIVNPETKVSLTLTAGQYLRYAITGIGGKATVMEQTSPSAQTELSTATSGTTTIGPYGATKSLVIAADNCVVEYDSGTSASLETGSADTLKNSGAMVLTGAGAPVDYTDGDPAATGEGWAAPGALYVDTTNKKLYINHGTAAQPLWRIVLNATTAGEFFFSGAGAPVDYTDGDPAATGEGVASKGAIYSDVTNGKLYVNGGTMAQPIWKIVTSAA